MKPREWFVVGVRLFGVWVLIAGVEELVALMEARFGMTSNLHTQLSAYLFHATVEFVMGMYLLAGAPVLVGFAFKTESAVTDRDSG